MFPTDETANLNAAVNALRHGDLDKAEAYLLKAGKSPQADYIRGIIAAKRDDYRTASTLLDAAAGSGLPQAAKALESLRDMKLIP